MKHYINPVTKEVYGYELDGSQDAFIAAGLVPISDADLAILRASQVIPLTWLQKRVAAYNLKTAGEQFEMMGDDKKNGTNTHGEWIAAIKLAIPKV